MFASDICGILSMPKTNEYASVVWGIFKWLRHTEYAENICGIHKSATNNCGKHKSATISEANTSMTRVSPFENGRNEKIMSLGKCLDVKKLSWSVQGIEFFGKHTDWLIDTIKRYDWHFYFFRFQIWDNIHSASLSIILTWNLVILS